VVPFDTGATSIPSPRGALRESDVPGARHSTSVARALLTQPGRPNPQRSSENDMTIADDKNDPGRDADSGRSSSGSSGSGNPGSKRKESTQGQGQGQQGQGQGGGSRSGGGANRGGTNQGGRGGQETRQAPGQGNQGGGRSSQGQGGQGGGQQDPQRSRNAGGALDREDEEGENSGPREDRQANR
jgi:hypothetical protein